MTIDVIVYSFVISTCMTIQRLWYTFVSSSFMARLWSTFMAIPGLGFQYIHGYS